MEQIVKDAVMASFVADALALGVHWVYDTAAIKNRYGRLERMVAPELAPYHNTKQKGAFTHYGDQAMVLLESVVQNAGFDLDHFSRAWQKMFADYNGYIDGATQGTLKNFQTDPGMNPPGSLSHDLGGASRIAPLALFYSHDKDAFVRSSRVQTAMTHNQPSVIDAAQFFAFASTLVFDGEKPSAAIEKSLEKIPESPNLKQMITAGLESKHEETAGAIARFGQMCSVEGALPSTIHLIAKYEDDLKQALVENVMAGGDSSARGMLAGFIIAACRGIEQIPQNWLDDMQAYQKIRDLMG